MYKQKSTDYAKIAIIYYFLSMLGLFAMGILLKSNSSWYHLIYIILFIVPVITVLLKDKSIVDLGISKNNNLAKNLLIASIMIIITFIYSMFKSDFTMPKLLKTAFYYLFYIGLTEEILYRGFIQNYLFGLKLNRYIIFIIGGIFFSLIHLPFQMYVHNMVSIAYIIQAIPQLISTFIIHLLFCYITYKRKDILITVAIHFAMNFLQSI